MPAILTKVRAEYVAGLQDVAADLIKASRKMDKLDDLYVGAGLSGTFSDAEMDDDPGTQHMVAADVGTYTANLNTVRAAVTTAIIRNMAKAVGKPVP